MRIDYSEPKKAYVTPQNASHGRKEPVGIMTTLIIVTAVIAFAAGFGSGWFLSQKAAKKSFQAATEQKSRESSANNETAAPKPVPPPVQPIIAAPQPQQEQQQTPQQPLANTTPDQALSFYKTLPSGQKSSVMGSGINTKEEMPAKQPLHAAIPSNLQNPQTVTADTNRPPAEKSATRQPDATSFSVQVASFPLNSEAESLKSKLAAKGYHVYIIESNQGEKGTWFRVRVGKKLEQAAAKELALKLGKSAIVIPDKD